MLKFTAHAPAKDAIGVSRTSPIYFEVMTDSSPLDVLSVNVSINGIDVIINGVYQTDFSGSIIENTRSYSVYISHADVWSKGSTITIDIDVSDISANDFSESYLFTVLTTDLENPYLIANPKGGIFASSQNVSLISNKPNTIIYYTLDGSVPDVSSLQFSVPLQIENDTVIKFFGIDEDDNKSFIFVESYKIVSITADHDVPVTSIDKPSGTYYSITKITLTTNESATIYWTINGNNPSVNLFDGKDTSPVTIELQEGRNQIRYFAVDLNGNVEEQKYAEFLIQPKENNLVPTNVFVSSPYIKHTLDICWDDMSPIEPNIIGYNVYRSQVSPRYLKNVDSHDIISADAVYTAQSKEFIKINQSLITSTFYRDQWLNKIVIEENVSDQFKIKTEIDASTDFDGPTVNANYWEAYDPHRLFHQFDGLHFVDVYGNSRESEFLSKFRISGDFDLQTEFSLIDWPITDSLTRSEAGIKLHFNKFTYISLSRIRIEATDYYVSKLVVDSSVISESQIALADLQGKFKITRFGSDVTTFYHDGSNWILINSYLAFSKDDLQIRYFVLSSNSSLGVVFSEFELLSGKALLPLITDSLHQYCIKTAHRPIATTENRDYNLYSDDVNNIQVLIDQQMAVIKQVDGIKGEITLDTERKYDHVLGKWINPPVPTPESIATVTYPYVINSFKLNLSRSPHYKVTCVLNDNTETILNICDPVTIEADKLDYMYQEAIRRNAWLLDQAGERVLLFKRKSVGIKCECYERNERTHKQPKIGPCKKCWGTGIVDGYDGPFEIKISPAQSEQKIAMTDRGMKLENTENTWTGITPIIDQRDFVLRRTFEIYAIGPVARPEVRGVATQQHFQIEHIDSTDIRYEFIQSLNLYNYSSKVGLLKPQSYYIENNYEKVKDGEITDDDILRTNKGIETDKPKGRTITFENSLF